MSRALRPLSAGQGALAATSGVLELDHREEGEHWKSFETNLSTRTIPWSSPVKGRCYTCASHLNKTVRNLTQMNVLP